jgi:hypothetical protein
LSQLELELDEYFGGINEIKAGLMPEKLPEKPVAYIFYEQCKELNLPLIEGGIMDQPHIWLMQWAVCMQREALWRSIDERSQSRKTQEPG